MPKHKIFNSTFIQHCTLSHQVQMSSIMALVADIFLFQWIKQSPKIWALKQVFEEEPVSNLEILNDKNYCQTLI